MQGGGHWTSMNDDLALIAPSGATGACVPGCPSLLASIQANSEELMYKQARAVAAALVALLVIPLMAPTAQALRSLEFGASERSVSSTGRVRFGIEGLRGTMEITCDITLLRTLNRAIAKVRGAVMGKITGVATDLRSCAHGEAIRVINDIRALRAITGLSSECRREGSVTLCVTTGGEERLWNLVYQSILGTLPNITGFLFEVERVQFVFDVQDAFNTQTVCAYEGNVPALGGVEVNILLEGVSLTARRLRGLACPGPARMGGRFTVRPEPTLRLV